MKFCAGADRVPYCRVLGKQRGAHESLGRPDRSGQRKPLGIVKNGFRVRFWISAGIPCCRTWILNRQLTESILYP